MERAGISSIREMTGRAAAASKVPMGSSPNLVRDAAGSDSWAESEIMKTFNRERAMTKRGVGRSRFVSRSVSSTQSGMDIAVQDSDSDI